MFLVWIRYETGLILWEYSVRGTSIQIATDVRPYLHGVPCIKSHYCGVTGAVCSGSPPTWVSSGHELEFGAVSVQINVTVAIAVYVGHCMPNKHIGSRHRCCEKPCCRVVTRSNVCFYGVVYHCFGVVVRKGRCQLCSKPNDSIYKLKKTHRH